MRRLAGTRVAALAALCAPLVLLVAPAAAAEPERSGWWNRLSGPGLALPQPTTAPGDLRVASGGDGPSAYAALLYSTAGAATATLDVGVRSGSAVGTVEVVACPTTATDWVEGENQPFDAAPAYDCAVGLAFGSLSADGTTLSFRLDQSLQVEPGRWSVALVPQPDAATPFAVDLVTPGPQAFVPELPSPPEPAGAAPAVPVNTGTAGTSSPPDVLSAPGLDLPALLGWDDPAVDVAAPEAAAPALAAAAPQTVVPTAVRTPGVAADLGGGGARLLALLVLVAGSAAFGYVSGQPRPGPRLLGGRARAVTAAVPVATGPELIERAGERPRGIGRFAKERTSGPRRLR